MEPYFEHVASLGAFAVDGAVQREAESGVQAAGLTLMVEVRGCCHGSPAWCLGAFPPSHHLNERDIRTGSHIAQTETVTAPSEQLVPIFLPSVSAL